MSDNEKSQLASEVIQTQEEVFDKGSDTLLDTDNMEYIIRYNLFNADEPIAGRDIPTGHANLTLIERDGINDICLLYTSPSPRDGLLSRMPSSA